MIVNDWLFRKFCEMPQEFPMNLMIGPLRISGFIPECGVRVSIRSRSPSPYLEIPKKLVAARRNIAPIQHGVIDQHCTVGSIAQG